ncbi:hypothetical protein GCM10023196_102380 [Actinoallomurus vinaceus]|uniref:Uncharacterized protein n=1 Tax=Actinoallomurus vinaceus TaxID=1080074 RepID=A0ABP8UVP7_9ACTN
MTIPEPPHPVPDSVVRTFREGFAPHTSDPISRVRVDQAALMARLRAPDGDVIEWWEAPNEAGGTCIYLRRLPPGGGKEGGSMESDSPQIPVPGVPPMHLVVEETSHMGRWFVGVHIYRAEAATVRLGFQDGRRHELAVQPNGYALDLIPWASHGQPWPSEALVLDAQGAIIERFPWDPAAHGLLSDEEA